TSGNRNIIYTTNLYPITFGDPFSMGFSAGAVSKGLGSDICNNCTGFDWSLASIEVFDANLNPVGAQITFASQTPEPRAAVLLLTCLALVVPVLRKKAKGQRSVA